MNGVNVFSLLGKLAIDGIDETKKALDDVAKEGEQAKNKLNVSFQDIGNKAGELGRSMAKGLSIGLAAITGSYEATKEFRTDLGRLEAGYQGVGMSGDTANKVFKDMFGILGETDTAVEASNLLKELAQDEKGLSEWTTIATGVYARFPDSIPIESLIEASNETAKVGQVTGTLADALNWAGVSEEQFNEKLEKCNSEAEREKLIRDTLNGLYKDSATEYQNNNKGLIDNNKAQAELNMKMAETMEKVEPLITKGKIFLAEVLMKLQPAITWIIDNINILAPIILGFMGSLFALNIASKIVAFIPILKTLFAVISANPIVLVITVIIAVIALLIANWDKVKEVTLKVWEAMKQAVSKAVNAIKSVIEKIFNGIKTYITTVLNIYKTIFTTVWNGIKTAVTTVVNGIKNTISNVFNGIKNVVTTVWNGIKNAIVKPIEKARDLIKGIIDKIKGFFNFDFKLPKIKLPHFSLKPSGWKIGDLLKGSIPKLGIDWYAKAMNNPMLLENPTAFGFSPSGNIRVGGETGSELVGGTNTIMGMIGDAVSSNNGGIESKLDRLISLLTNYLPTLSNQQVVLSTGELVGALTSPLDKSLGQLADDRRRGR